MFVTISVGMVDQGIGDRVMVEVAGSKPSGVGASKETPVLRTHGLLAEYTLGQSVVTGEWFALGTVRSEERPELRHPAWVLVGTGESREDAVSHLLTAMEREALRLHL